MRLEKKGLPLRFEEYFEALAQPFNHAPVVDLQSGMVMCEPIAGERVHLFDRDNNHFCHALFFKTIR